MNHARSLRFEDLEARKLLAVAHAGVAQAAPAAVSNPLVLDGTLTVENQSSSTIMNIDGSWTTSIPVTGQLGTVGKVSGFWNSSVDAYGNYEGPDTIQLHNGRGSFTVSFDNANPGRARPIAHGIAYHQQTQHVTGGSGHYAKATERGPVDLITNTSKSTIVSLGLDTPDP